ncbi:MAG: hypothetical protein V2A78_01740 [bacterium]
MQAPRPGGAGGLRPLLIESAKPQQRFLAESRADELAPARGLFLLYIAFLLYLLYYKLDRR